MELLDLAGTQFDLDEVLAGNLTPICFGSALTNFGVQLFLDHFVGMAPEPQAQETAEGTEVIPTDETFSGFVFKIQANMDKRHRDRVAYMRVVSGKFERDLDAWVPRLKRRVRLSRPMRLFGSDREVVEEAYAGDVVGLVSTGTFTIGDTISDHDIGTFPPLPRFQPEHFALLRHTRADRYKQFLKGLTQIEEEGAIQLFYPVSTGSREPVLAAVGALQFEVVRYRLESEYNVETELDPLSYTAARWVTGEENEITTISNGRGRMRAEDRDGRPIVLFTTEWDLRYAEENARNVTFSALAEV
jgi:peptide chain release factor 3